MLQENSELSDEIQITTGQGAPGAKKEYEVIAEPGLFKNGQQINKGEKVSLDEKTAKNFLASNDIKEI